MTADVLRLTMLASGLGAFVATLVVTGAAAAVLLWWMRREVEDRLHPIVRRLAAVERLQDRCRACREAEVSADV